jgi:hypothetical protein
LLVEVAQRQPGELGLHLLPQPVDGPLHDRGGEPALQDPEQRRHDVDDGNPGQDGAEEGEIDALAGNDVHRGQHVGQVVLAAPAQRLDLLRLADVGVQSLADDAAEDDVGGAPEQQRAGDRQRHAGHAEGQRRGDEEAVRPQHAEQPPAGALEVLQFLGGHLPGHHPGGRSEADAGRPPDGGGHPVTPCGLPSRPGLRSVHPFTPPPPLR